MQNKRVIKQVYLRTKVFKAPLWVEGIDYSGNHSYPA